MFLLFMKRGKTSSATFVKKASQSKAISKHTLLLCMKEGKTSNVTFVEKASLQNSISQSITPKNTSIAKNAMTY